MTREEYEARRQRLDEELRAALEMLKVGHQAQVQALDLLWRMSADGGAQPSAPPPASKPKPAAHRRGAGVLRDEVTAILPRLPELFTKDDVARLLGEVPDRASLLRILRELETTGSVRTEIFGRGRNPSVYRRLVPAAATPDATSAAESA
jgi:hypothetical protein